MKPETLIKEEACDEEGDELDELLSPMTTTIMDSFFKQFSCTPLMK